MLVQFYNVIGSEESTLFLVGEKDGYSHKPPGRDTGKFHNFTHFLVSILLSP